MEDHSPHCTACEASPLWATTLFHPCVQLAVGGLWFSSLLGHCGIQQLAEHGDLTFLSLQVKKSIQLCRELKGTMI